MIPVPQISTLESVCTVFGLGKGFRPNVDAALSFSITVKKRKRWFLAELCLIESVEVLVDEVAGDGQVGEIIGRINVVVEEAEQFTELFLDECLLLGAVAEQITVY